MPQSGPARRNMAHCLRRGGLGGTAVRQSRAVDSEATRAGDSRTRLQRCLLDLVLPVGTLISTSFLTAAIIVLVVTTVAQAEFHAPNASSDKWSRWAVGTRVPPSATVFDQAYASEALVVQDWPPTSGVSPEPFDQ